MTHDDVTTILATRVSPELRRAVKRYCRRHSITVQQMVAEAIRSRLGKPIRASRRRRHIVSTRLRPPRGRLLVAAG